MSEEERLRQQKQENISSPSQPRQGGILSSKKARRSVLLGSTALGLGLILSSFMNNDLPLFWFWAGNGIILVGSMCVWIGSRAQREGALRWLVGGFWVWMVGVGLLDLSWGGWEFLGGGCGVWFVSDFVVGSGWFGLLIFLLFLVLYWFWGVLVWWWLGLVGFIIYLTSIYYGRW